MVLVILASPMGTVTSPPPKRSDDDHDVEALEA
jgi:hypothetical protein